MTIEPDLSGVSIVLLGRFNPAIFTPDWFARHDLLPESAAENANLQLVHPQTTSFSTEWLQLNVFIDRFEATTQFSPTIRVSDFVTRVFREHLFHTPINALGINRHVHFSAPSQSAKHRVGRLLAPIEPWSPCIEKIGLNIKNSGMLSLTMADTQPEGRSPGGQLSVTVEPSNRTENQQSGIYVGTNDHYVVDGNNVNGCEQLMSVLEENFDSSIQRSNTIIDHIMSLAKEERGREI